MSRTRARCTLLTSARLTSRITNKTFAIYATGLYILTTSPVTSSSPYTEPLFACLTCTGFWLILPSRISKSSGAELIISKVLGLLCLIAATATRSLGILNALPVIWQGFIQPIFQGDRRLSVSDLCLPCDVCLHCISSCSSVESLPVWQR